MNVTRFVYNNVNVNVIIVIDDDGLIGLRFLLLHLTVFVVILLLRFLLILGILFTLEMT
jgi:hypothetical protein